LGSESETDFIHKISISIKETHESQYWLELLVDGEYINQEQFDKLYSVTDELIRMMTASVLTLKKRQGVASAT
jgi:four helix bundle protein